MDFSFGRVEAEESNGGEGHEIGARTTLKKRGKGLFAALHLLHFAEPIHSTVDSIGDKRRRRRRAQWQKEMSLFTRTKHPRANQAFIMKA